jgi:FADH2 O2-dependent halogenase
VKADFDIAVVGSGFAGSLMAMIARRLGRSVVLLERGKHPRFVIGESSTPLANLLLEELADRYDLPRVRPLSKWGTWQAAHPKVACGLKRGFTFYHHTFGAPFTDDDRHARQLLVAASPRDAIADTHWYRPDFDHLLAREAQAAGAEFLDEAKLGGIELRDAGATILGERHGQPLKISARFVLDASGPRGFLHRALELPELPLEKLPATQGLYTHFTDVRRWDELHPDPEPPPYPVDDAALHHVFAGGWIWVLRFNNGLISAGVAATDALASELNLAEGAPAWERLLDRLPGVREQFAGARAQFPFVHAPRLAFLSGYVTGPQWALLPSAAGFIDPLLSTGFPLTLLGVTRLARLWEEAWGREELRARLFGYSMQTTMELVTTERLIAALYSSMDDFELFRALSLLYFAAASFTETARRLGHPELAGDSFLLLDQPVFGPRARYCVDLALRQPTGAPRVELLERIEQTIAPMNVVGLGDRDRHHWYPCRAEDLFAAAPKLSVDRAAIEAMLRRCAFAAEIGKRE